MVIGLHDMYIDVRHLIDAENFVGIEVALLNTPFIDGDGTFQRRGEAVNNPALDLLSDDPRVHDMPAIDGANHAVYFELALVD